jgi:hypothetical protein
MGTGGNDEDRAPTLRPKGALPDWDDVRINQCTSDAHPRPIPDFRIHLKMGSLTLIGAHLHVAHRIVPETRTILYIAT